MSVKGDRSLTGGRKKTATLSIRHLNVSPSYLLTVCTSPASTLSMQRCGTSSSSFQQTLCHTMSERVQMESRGAISLNTRAAERITKTFYQSIWMLRLNTRSLSMYSAHHYDLARTPFQVPEPQISGSSLCHLSNKSENFVFK